ncbi:hypothetical protein [Streptomyces sp. NPDC005385]|uniref:hypothetical protein n=1 Tax=Streptomyces sp. NPDC005385 TaxID=3157039 RepID=UPI0033A3C3A8
MDDYASGPEFLMFASHLPYYDGAVKAIFMAEVNKADQAAGSDYAGQSPNAPQTMSMAQALAQSQGDDMGVLDALNQDDINSGLGPLFEREVVQT